MKHIIKLSLVLLLLAFTFANCSKGGGGDDGGTPPAEEASLVVGLNPEPSTGINQSLSSTYTFNVMVNSTMPAQGVEIKVDYVKDANGASIFSQTLSATAASTPVTVTNVPFFEVGTVTVKVTSKTKTSNTVTKSFKLVKK